MERLGVLDSGFWAIEDEHVAVHIGGVAIFDGPVPPQDEILRRYAAAVDAHPRYRQKLHKPVLPLTRASWVDDAAFELTHHVRRLAVPRPLTDRELDDVVGELMSRRLDPHRALWRALVLEGLAGGRWAVITQVHHSMVDGMGMMDLFVDLLDHAPKPGPRAGAQAQATRPLGGVRRSLGSIAHQVASATVQPVRTTRAVVADARGFVDLALALHPTEANSLIGSLHTPRTYRTVRLPMADVQVVQEQSGCTVNDVALTLAARAFRRLLRSRGEPTGPRAVRCMVPVSTRQAARAPNAGNHVSALLVDLPVDFADPAACFGAVVARTRRLKTGHGAAVGELGVAAAGWLPVPLVAGFLRATRHVPQHMVTTVVTNVPGPRRDLSLSGRPLLELYPYVPIAEHIRIGLALTSYAGQLTFGITCDRDSVPDVDVFVAGLGEGLAELLDVNNDHRRH